MRDFTLYLHEIDPTRFTSCDSRYGGLPYAEEWKRAWDDYATHIQEASTRFPVVLTDYASSLWRQDLRDSRCVRKKALDRIEFSAVTGFLDLRIQNDVTSKALTFRYMDVVELSWKASSYQLTLWDSLNDELGVELPVLMLEEIRFDADGIVEHELRLLGGSILLIRALKVSLDIHTYLK